MQQATAAAPRRAGGREARRAARARPLAAELRPVWPGMPSPGIGPLKPAGMECIHQAILRVLEETGFGEVPDSTRDTLVGAGAVFDTDTGRVRFPRALVEDAIAAANRNFVLHARNPDHSLQLGGEGVYFGTGGAAVHVVDLETRTYRESTLRDLYDAARVVDVCDNIHYFQRPMVARDMPTARDLDVNTTYACLAGTSKHIAQSINDADTFGPVLELLHLAAGGEDAWRRAPFANNANCFVVPPLKFAADSCAVLERAARAGMPVLALSAGQAGATAPAAIAGAVTQAFAEAIIGMLYVNAISPGHPVIVGAWPFVSDLRTGAMSGGSGEQALLTSACGQMARFYSLPTGSAAGMADAKLPDAQSGYEKGITLATAGLSGLNMVYESAGMQASLLGFSPDGLLIDNDLIGSSLRIVRGIEVTEESCSVETIHETCLHGPGHYLGSNQTLSLMQTEYVYPQIADRMSPKEWAEVGNPDILQTAISRRREILETHFPDHIDAEMDTRIRAAFDIRLPREVMQPG